MNKQITYKEYKVALAEKERIEKYLQHLTNITRAYIYQEEAQRVRDRKKVHDIDNNKTQGR